MSLLHSVIITENLFLASTERPREETKATGGRERESTLEWYGLFYSRNRAEILLTEAFLSASDPQ